MMTDEIRNEVEIKNEELHEKRMKKYAELMNKLKVKSEDENTEDKNGGNE